MSLGDALATIESNNRAIVQQDTFGHLAPKRNEVYKGRLVFGIGCFGCDTLNPTALFCEFDGLDSSPWFFDAVCEFMQDRELTAGCVYEFLGTFKNYEFTGPIKLVFDTNSQ